MRAVRDGDVSPARPAVRAVSRPAVRVPEPDDGQPGGGRGPGAGRVRADSEVSRHLSRRRPVRDVGVPHRAQRAGRLLSPGRCRWSRSPTRCWTSRPTSPARRLQLEHGPDVARLRKALLRLRDDRRELIVLARYQGLRHDQIAELLDIEVGAVKVRLHRAIAELRDVFRQAGRRRFDYALFRRQPSSLRRRRRHTDRRRAPGACRPPGGVPDVCRRRRGAAATVAGTWQRAARTVGPVRAAPPVRRDARGLRGRCRVGRFGAAGGLSSLAAWLWRPMVQPAWALGGVGGSAGARRRDGKAGGRRPRHRSRGTCRCCAARSRDLRQMVSLSLLQQQSASERLKGVAWAAQLESGDGSVVTALLDALSNDPNVNVRLASVDALKRFATQDAVRRGAVTALERQTSPLVQIALDRLRGGSRAARRGRHAAATGRQRHGARGRAGPRRTGFAPGRLKRWPQRQVFEDRGVS